MKWCDIIKGSTNYHIHERTGVNTCSIEHKCSKHNIRIYDSERKTLRNITSSS